MPRITSAEIRELVVRTRAGSVIWRVEGRRCHALDYLVELRDTGGPVLSSLETNGMLVTSVARARIGLLPRGRLLHDLATAIERQVIEETIDLTDGARTDGDPSEVADEAAEAVTDLTKAPPVPSHRSPSGRTAPSAPAPPSDPR